MTRSDACRGNHVRPRADLHRCAFTLLELLLVVAVLGLLVAILMPSLSHAKLLAKVAKAKAELYGIATALVTYRTDQRTLPPARTYCEYGDQAKANDWAELPPELGNGYYSPGPPGSNLTLNAVDPFNPGRTYKYLKPGRGYHNNAGTYISFWVPDEFPSGDMDTGKDYSSEKNSPVSFVLWSVGTYGDIGYWNALEWHHPFDTREWYGAGKDKGIIVRALMPSGAFVMSP
ncbi:MAG: prepilin-type N-terminal cleavage/methylation domain-containing protein [Phycisphaerae bacterium]|nr:prepilin-type N-terminal cleavage/methylation domain-containing protein [Phycisphaerae bacterium]